MAWEDSNFRRDRVISEKPKPGTVLRKGGKVDLVVSGGSEG
jgi:beta-lactam-binding protein with PASTA domain